MKKLGIVLIVSLMLILVIDVISCVIGRDSNTNCSVHRHVAASFI